MIKTGRDSWPFLNSGPIFLHTSAYFIVLLPSTYCQYLFLSLFQDEENINLNKNIFPLLGTIKETPYMEYMEILNKKEASTIWETVLYEDIHTH